MHKILKGMKKMKVSPVTGGPPEAEEEQRWLETAEIVKDRIGMSPTNVKMELTNPQVVAPIMDKAPKKEIPALLMKTVQDIDKDRLMGKRLAMNITRRTRGLITPDVQPTPSFPVVTVSKRTPIIKKLANSLNPFTPAREGEGQNSLRYTPGTELTESRPYNPQELSELRREYAQNGMKDATFIVRLWEKGADTVMLHEQEMRKIRNIIENPSIFEALEHCLDTSRGDTHPLLDWVTAAWRYAFPSLDLTQFETAGKWSTYQEAINTCRKLGILWFIYNQAPTPQAAPLTPAFKCLLISRAW